MRLYLHFSSPADWSRNIVWSLYSWESNRAHSEQFYVYTNLKSSAKEPWASRSRQTWNIVTYICRTRWREKCLWVILILRNNSLKEIRHEFSVFLVNSLRYVSRNIFSRCEARLETGSSQEDTISKIRLSYNGGAGGELTATAECLWEKNAVSAAETSSTSNCTLYEWVLCVVLNAKLN